MSSNIPVVFIVDDDVSARESLELLVRNENWKPEAFASAQEFLDHPRTPVPSCLVLDLSLPGLNGLNCRSALRSNAPTCRLSSSPVMVIFRRRCKP
jgi:FixJ family two-component response regulator